MKIKKLFMSISSVITAFSLLTAANVYSPMKASAWDNQLNIRITMCTTMCVSFSSICDSVTLGTYGTPSSFNDRLPNTTGYVYGYYANCGAHVNFLDFSTSNLRNSPARICADDYSNNESMFLDVVQNGCKCNRTNGSEMSGVIACVNGNHHHNHFQNFFDDLPSYNSNNVCALYLTASTLCGTSDSTHFYINGVSDHNAMSVVVRDHDYAHTHDISQGETNPYAYVRETMIHEIGHLYYVADHYGQYATANSDPDCVWGDNAYNYHIANTAKTCSTCRSSIYANRDIYHHT